MSGDVGMFFEATQSKVQKPEGNESQEAVEIPSDTFMQQCAKAANVYMYVVNWIARQFTCIFLGILLLGILTVVLVTGLVLTGTGLLSILPTLNTKSFPLEWAPDSVLMHQPFDPFLALLCCIIGGAFLAGSYKIVCREADNVLNRRFDR